MGLLTDHRWKAKYTPDDGDLVGQFYVRALESAVRYDRTTGFFTASALAVAARGIEGLVRSGGRMRMLVGCTLEQAEADAIGRGEDLKDTASAAMLRMPLIASDADVTGALELLAWMVAKGILEVKVAIPCDEQRKPVSGIALFHEKSGVIEDKTGDRIAFAGSVNETAQGWKYNWESFHVFCSWAGGQSHIDEEEASFARLWEDRSPRALVIDVPEAVRKQLMQFLPRTGEPVRMKKEEPDDRPELVLTPTPNEAPLPLEPTLDDHRRRIWDFIRTAAARPDGVCVGEATSAITPWPHQIRAFHRLYDQWPPKLLIADEVGLGKTIEAGLLIRQAWLSGRARRILILAPKAVLRQWQVELREKFNLNWPIYDGRELSWYPSQARREAVSREVSRDTWHDEPCVIVSSQLMRRRERQTELLVASQPWDLVILDEAHHARRSSPGQPGEGGPNLLLRLMQGLKDRTQGLVLLTATPMQVHPIEVWDLLRLLGLPGDWDAASFLDYFRLTGGGATRPEEFDRAARLFQSTERRYGATREDEVIRHVPGGSRIRTRRILAALRDVASTPRRQLSQEDRQAAFAILRARSPVAALISRHTRDLLRHYHRLGKIKTPIATRNVEDRFLDLAQPEAVVYEAVEDYISSTYNAAAAEARSAVGFVMTIYRRRLASSFHALACTLRERLAALSEAQELRPKRPEEDVSDDETVDDPMDVDDAVTMERKALAFEERSEIARLLRMVEKLPPDTKALALEKELKRLADAGYEQTIVFTQYTDTLDALRERLVRSGLRILCFSGRGGERLDPTGNWRGISREETRRRFKAGEAQVLLATDAAAEGLNFQFCGALINYDSPWNPMRIEQRIGRIDRLGQRFEQLRVVNLMYDNTVETDVYRALRTRIQLFTAVVGRLQPILASLPRRIASATLAPEKQAAREALREDLNASIDAAASGFDIDAAADAALELPARPVAPLTRDDLLRVLQRRDLLPDGFDARPLGSREFAVDVPGVTNTVRVTTDPEFFEEQSESEEFWTPGSPAFPPGAPDAPPADLVEVRNLSELLDR